MQVSFQNLLSLHKLAHFVLPYSFVMSCWSSSSVVTSGFTSFSSRRHIVTFDLFLNWVLAYRPTFPWFLGTIPVMGPYTKSYSLEKLPFSPWLIFFVFIVESCGHRPIPINLLCWKILSLISFHFIFIGFNFFFPQQWEIRENSLMTEMTSTWKT